LEGNHQRKEEEDLIFLNFTQCRDGKMEKKDRENLKGKLTLDEDGIICIKMHISPGNPELYDIPLAELLEELIDNEVEMEVIRIKPMEEIEIDYKKYLETNELPLPTEEQVLWLEAEIGMFCHFGVNTYSNLEWSDGTVSPSVFNPTKLDCNQWVKSAKELGAKYMILTAKHHDGFCLWPTTTTDYSVKSSPFKDGNGDVVKEFLDACKKENMNAGLYLSPWDRHEPCYQDKEAYDKLYITQLTELLSSYDTDMFEIWFDGAGSVGREYDWASMMDVCHKYHPKAMIFNMGEPTIRWVGNEDGLAKESNWNVMKMGKDFTQMKTEDIIGVGLKLKENHGFGNIWMPAECDTTIRKGHWFYHTDDEKSLRTLDKLLEIYEKSVGRGANLLLNLAPNREGLIEPSDAKRTEELGDEIRRRYSNPLSTSKGEGKIIEMELEKEEEIDCIILQEDIRKGQRVRDFHIECLKGDEWIPLSKSTSIGYKKILHFNKTTVKKIRIVITNTLADPIVSNIALYLTNI
jgi:alpha-L-fucosidase